MITLKILRCRDGYSGNENTDLQKAEGQDYSIHMNIKHLLQSIGALVAGMLTGAILSIATDAVLEGTGVFPSFAEQQASGSPTWLLLWATLYRTLYTILGCNLAARLAPSKPMRHAMMLGVLGFIANIAGGIAMWNVGQHWYPIALAVLSVAAGYVGGKIHQNTLKR